MADPIVSAPSPVLNLPHPVRDALYYELVGIADRVWDVAALVKVVTKAINEQDPGHEHARVLEQALRVLGDLAESLDLCEVERNVAARARRPS